MKKLFFTIPLLVFLTGCTQPLLGGDCGTVTPGYNDACCRRQNSGVTIPAKCPGNWFYDSNTSQCEYECYYDVFEQCSPDVPCQEGQICATLLGIPYCFSEDPCEFVQCGPGEECVQLESYPVQLSCS